MSSTFWHGKRVLLTGHTGFKGSWLALWLQRLGADVLGYALEPPTEPSLFERARVAEGMHSEIADIRDLAKLTQIARSFRPEILIHMAAQAIVRVGYADPVDTYSTNVMGTVHVLEVMRSIGARAGVIVTSDKCYENREWLWGYRESEPMGGRDPYSSSKACAELVTHAYQRSFFDGASGPFVASARAGNVIGGADWGKDRLVPDAMRAFTDGKPLLIRNPDAIRPWQHVLEPLRGYLSLAERLYEDGAAFVGGWNFGPHASDTWSVRRVADRLVELWGRNAEWRQDTGSQPHEARALALDCSQAAATLSWHPRLAIDDALAWVVAWHAAASDNDARRLTEADIERYEAATP